MNFKTFHFAKQIMKQIEVIEYKHPTPIQEQAIPIVLEGKDVMGLAQTGTGKTAAFVLPILQNLLKGPRKKIRAMIIAPTRELVEQTHSFIKITGRHTGLRSVTVYGGTNTQRQIANLRKGAEIIVACPGRLLDLLKQKVVSLKDLEILVLDEADHMFDMGFLPDLKRILRHIPSKRQTLLFSATMPQSISQLAYSILKNPCRIEIDYTSPLKSITHFLFPIKQHLKTSLLLELLRTTDAGSTLIFTRTKRRARSLGEKLKKKGFSAIAIQGNLSQNKRQAALKGFKDGTYQIMVATDIAARGIDVTNITHVINFDIPDTPEAYTHRTGRTGRAKCTGKAFTFVTDDDLKVLHTLERHVGVELRCRTINGFDYDAEQKTSSPQQKKQFRKPYRRKRSRAKAS